MTGTLDGLKVLDLTSGIAGPIATMLLADQGAGVTKIEPPGGDPFAATPGYRVWNRGKRSAILDLEDTRDRDRLVALASRADVVVETFGPGITERLGLTHDDLSARNPRLITCSITGYGRTGPDADRPAIEALVAARTGNQWTQRGGILSSGEIKYPDIPIPEGAEQGIRKDGPMFSSSPWLSLTAGYHASVGITAALVARESTGRGQWVHTALSRRSHDGRAVETQAAPHAGGWMSFRGAPKGLFECGDGRWVHHWSFKPLTVIQAAEADDLDHAETPAYRTSRDDPNRLPMGEEGIVEIFYYFPLLTAAFKKFPAEEWAKWGARSNVGIQVIRSAEEALTDDWLLEDGCVVEVDDPELGRIRHVGIVQDFSVTPGRVQAPAPTPGQHTAEVVAEADNIELAAVAYPGGTPVQPERGGPLEGVTVLDLGVALAGPFGAVQLANMGADVIKVNAPWDGWWMSTGIAFMANQGKRSIALNIQEERGLEVLRRMVAKADVVMHNMREGVGERLKVDYQSLLPYNPNLIYCHSRGFDRTRAAMKIPGTDQSASALAGQEWEDGGCWRGGNPFFGTSLGDLGNGYLSSIAIMEALYHRSRTGQGQEIGTSILNACLVTSSYTYVGADGTGADRPKLDALQLGLTPYHRLYRTAGEGWVCVAALTPAQQQRLTKVLGVAALDDEATLEGLFATRGAAEWVKELDTAGVPAEISAPPGPDTPQHGGMIDFSVTPGKFGRRAPKLGEHTTEILAWAGCTQDEIDLLLAEKIAFEAD